MRDPKGAAHCLSLHRRVGGSPHSADLEAHSAAHVQGAEVQRLGARLCIDPCKPVTAVPQQCPARCCSRPGTAIARGRCASSSSLLLLA